MDLPIFISTTDLITIRSNAFLREGMTFLKPMVVNFPLYIDGELGVALAIIAEADKAKVDKAWDDLRDLSDPTEDNVKAIIKKLPKRIWATSLLREVVCINAATNESEEFLPAGKFAETLRQKCGGDAVEEIELQKFIDAVKASCPARKKIVIHHHKGNDGKNYFALSSKNKRYPIWDYCIE